VKIDQKHEIGWAIKNYMICKQTNCREVDEGVSERQASCDWPKPKGRTARHKCGRDVGGFGDGRVHK
jgi:hypothetical protein